LNIKTQQNTNFINITTFSNFVLRRLWHQLWKWKDIKLNSSKWFSSEGFVPIYRFQTHGFFLD